MFWLFVLTLFNVFSSSFETSEALFGEVCEENWKEVAPSKTVSFAFEEKGRNRFYLFLSPPKSVIECPLAPRKRREKKKRRPFRIAAHCHRSLNVRANTFFFIFFFICQSFLRLLLHGHQKLEVTNAPCPKF